MGDDKEKELQDLRDFFATQMSSDEIQELMFRHMSRLAQERLVGRPHPEEYRGDDLEKRVDGQVDNLRFKIEVNAALRFMLADAMIAARNLPAVTPHK